MPNAFFTGLAGQSLTDAEHRFLRDAQPAGIILFARNIATPEQVRRLVADARSAIGADDVLVLIDQEGGRVQRLRPPHWRALPEAATFKSLGEGAATSARLVAHLTAQELRALGINCNCAPVLDLPVPGAHDIIGSRAYDTSVGGVVALGRAVMQGYIDGGVVPVVKHIPGHGRATADSHLALPVVTTDRATLAATDFAPFKALNDAPAAMTAHVVFAAIDPQSPASTSAKMHQVMRDDIGFNGLLMSDDLSMKALTAASFVTRAQQVFAAGSDIALHCNGDMIEMEQVAAGSPSLRGTARTRFDRALALTRDIAPLDDAMALSVLAKTMAIS